MRGGYSFINVICGFRKTVFKINFPFSVKLKAIANEADSKLYFSPPELLLDVPFSMGCYQGSTANAETVDPITDTTPASCILGCALKGPEYRFAGLMFF